MSEEFQTQPGPSEVELNPQPLPPRAEWVIPPDSGAGMRIYLSGVAEAPELNPEVIQTLAGAMAEMQRQIEEFVRALNTRLATHSRPAETQKTTNSLVPVVQIRSR